jgi:hypothetical protein
MLLGKKVSILPSRDALKQKFVTVGVASCVWIVWKAAAKQTKQHIHLNRRTFHLFVFCISECEKKNVKYYRLPNSPSAMGKVITLDSLIPL